MQEISTNPLTRDTIVILQSVSDEVLAKLYERCTVTLFPSHYEGYGLPVAEALALGKPCIAARGGSLGEIGGELVKRIDSRDVFGWADAIATSFKDCAAMKDWGDRIRAQYRPVTWDDAAVSFFAGIQRAS
jgi:glycosyltransferase involved in cell wall biosynthesis